MKNNNVKKIGKVVIGFVAVVITAVVIVSGLHVRKITGSTRSLRTGAITYDTIELHNGKIERSNDVTFGVDNYNPKVFKVWFAW